MEVNMDLIRIKNVEKKYKNVIKERYSWQYIVDKYEDLFLSKKQIIDIVILYDYMSFTN